jgi:hypothetical protein
MDARLDAFLDLVDGARWVRVDRHHHRMYVWKEGESVRMYSTDTAEDLDDWPCQASAESAALVVAERINQGYYS